jgi:penicillin-binding protein 2
MLDRNGVVIAGNRPSFRVLVVRDETKDLDQTLDLLGRLLPDTMDRRRSIIREVNAAPRFSPVPVKSDLTWEEFARVNLYANELPGVMADMNEARFYPFGGAFAHVIGYVAKVSDRDIKAISDKGESRRRSSTIPVSASAGQGVEKALDADLRGEAGGNRVEVDARGRVVAEDVGGSRPAVQRQGRRPDPRRRCPEPGAGGVRRGVGRLRRHGRAQRRHPVHGLSAVVRPQPVRRRRALSIYRALSDYERKPLLDKTIGGVFHPGSTFKLTTALALLESGVDPTERVVCTGGYRFGNRVFRCWEHRGHGAQDMHDAIKNSCDVYFYHMCNRAGVDKIQDVAKKIGFMQTFDIGVGNQKTGSIPAGPGRRTTTGTTRIPIPVWYPGETCRWRSVRATSTSPPCSWPS